MEIFKGDEKERLEAVKKIWENQNKLYQTVQFYLKPGFEKTAVEQRMIETAMWLRLYLEVESIKPDIKVAIGTNEKTCECHGVQELKCPARMQ